MEAAERERRAQAFGAEAARYDRARPSYPPELVDALLAEPAPRVLDIGCGTGKASRLFRERGCQVLGVEPDEQMAAMALAHGLDVEISAFEEWEPRGRRFPLAICAQAWHWVDPERGIPKLVEALERDGRFAAFWNSGDLAPDVKSVLDRVYDEHAPSVDRALLARPQEVAATLTRADVFVSVDVLEFPWQATYTSTEWLDVVATHSDHIILPATQRQRLRDALAAAIEDLGGMVPVSYVTRAVVARLA